MKTAGIVLIILQCIALFGNIMSGGSIFQFGGIREVCNFIGFFLPAILGVIFIAVGNKKKNKKQEEKDTK